MSTSKTPKQWGKVAALLAAGATAGIIGGSVISASAASSTPSPSSSTAPQGPGGYGGYQGGGPRGGGPGGNHGAPGETVVTGSKAATLKAAALKQVPGGTVDRVETDSGDAAYEVHMTNSSGTQVTVKFDKSLNYVSVEAGMGK